MHIIYHQIELSRETLHPGKEAIEESINPTHFFPMAKAMMVEWFLVKKYFPPDSNTQSSLSDRWAKPACFKRFFASSTSTKISPRSIQEKRIQIFVDQSERSGGEAGLPTAWKLVGEALRKSTRSRAIGSTVAMTSPWDDFDRYLGAFMARKCRRYDFAWNRLGGIPVCTVITSSHNDTTEYK